MIEEHDRQTLSKAAQSLRLRYGGTFDDRTIERCLHDCYVQLAAAARVRTYLPLLAERAATQRLDELRCVDLTSSAITAEIGVRAVSGAGR